MTTYYSVVVSVLSFIIVCRFEPTNSLSPAYIEQIERSKNDVQQIKNYILNGAGKHKAYDRLANITDRFGPRLAGSKNLEDAIDYMMKLMKEEDNFDDVFTENVTIPSWKPIKGEAQLVSSYRNKTIRIAVLGYSVSGSGEAEVVVVKTFDELEERKDEVNGKIVVYNQPCPDYSSCVVYRSRGASRAAKYGAVAAFIRSATQYSIYSVHTGMMSYENASVPKIPAACLTVEDVQLIQRIVDRGVNVKIKYDIQTQISDDTTSRNVIAEIKGVTFPDEVIIFGGHSDSWDLTDGSMDDGAGFMLAWEALSTIKKLDLKPKRTLRVVLWTSEEIGLIGGKAYYDRHQNESGNVSLIMESDHGVFEPRGLMFTGANVAKDILKTIMETYLKDINTTEIKAPGDSSDTEWWITEKKVPGCELFAYNERYFDFHHTEGDTMTVLNADHIDKATTLWATVVLAVANMDEMLPRFDVSSQISLNDNNSCFRCAALFFLSVFVYYFSTK